jgi:hypothetical protein
MADYQTYDHEQVYQQQYRRFSQLEVPHCTHCGSATTASVQAGLIGLTIRLAAMCPKFKLIPNGPKPGKWFCNSCQQFFDTPCEPQEGASA